MYNFLRSYKITTSFVLLLCIACTGSTNSRLEQALKLAGKNRIELEKVLTHYSANPGDTLKYKAACFLIENMSIHFYHKYNQEYYPIMDSLNQTKLNTDTVYAKFDSIKNKIQVSETTIFSDLNSLSSKFLIEHIDKSFETWRKSPWGNKIKFTDFCEYILPYAVSNEKREIWIDYYKQKYQHYLSAYLHSTHPDSLNLHQICETLNDSLKKNGKLLLYHYGLTNFPPIIIDRIRSGNCEDYVARTIYLMRSLCIPVGFDFSPQWINFNSPHAWNTLLTENGRHYPFTGFETELRHWMIEKTFNCPKIFRKTFSIQPESLAQQGFDEPLPGFLNQSNIIDVSAEYFPVTDVTIDIIKKSTIKSKVVYLCVFNNKDWVPVYWGKIRSNKATFKNMGKGIVYLPAYYSKGSFTAANNPFVLDSIGKVHPIKSHETLKETLVLNRKYYTIKSREYPVKMLKGQFQGSNDSAFNHYQIIHIIDKLPAVSFNTVKIDTDRKFRYVRYIGGHWSFTNVAELEFYSKVNNNLKKLSGKVIGTNGSWGVGEKGRTKESAFDGDILTFFDAPSDSGCWVGMDLGKKTKIEEIRYLPRNDDNNIRLGDEYELFYWSNSGWNSLGIKKGVSAVLKYNQCPVGALFLLRNYTRGKEERIFMYEKGKQVWW